MRIEEVRTSLCARLRARRDEIEQSALTRVRAVPDPKGESDPEYAEGLRLTVAAAIDYGIAALERSEDIPHPIPNVLLVQARLAARHGVSLDTVLRRYLVGYTLLGDFVIEESEWNGISNGRLLKRLLRVQAALFDRLVAAITEEYKREAEQPGSSEGRRAKRVQQLLAGELLDAAELRYDFESHHLGLVARGLEADRLRDLARRLEGCLLLVQPDDDLIWAWLGSRDALDPERVVGLIGPCSSMTLAVGEPGAGRAGWRLTHRQARAALPIALRRGESVVRYANVAVLASIFSDDLLATSLHDLYVAPLLSEPDRGATLRATLRAYFLCGRNISSTAAALRVSRQTVNRRLQSAEQLLGWSVSLRAMDIEVALCLEELAGRAEDKMVQEATTTAPQ